MFRRAGSLIKLSPKYSKSKDAISALLVRRAAGDVITSMCRDYPQEIEKQIKVTTYKNGVLRITTPAVIAGELHMRAGEIVDGVNARLGKKAVLGIRFK